MAGLSACREQGVGTTGQAQSELSEAEQELARKLVLSDADLKRVEELRIQAKAGDGRLTDAVFDEPGSARWFTYLAASGDEPAVVEAGLEGMVRGSPGADAHLQPPYDVYVQAVVRNLPSGHGPVAARALQAAQVALRAKQPSAELLDAVVAEAMRRDDGPLAYEALQLMKGMPRSRQGQVAEALSHLLDAKAPHVLAEALAGLTVHWKHLTDVASVRSRAFELADHESAGVRGRALSLLSVVASADSDVMERAVGALSDGDPFVRASACRALVQLRRPAAIHELMPLVDDAASSTTTLAGWQRPTGEPGSLELSVGRRKRVDEAALAAVGVLAGRPFQPLNLEHDATWLEDLARHRDAARAWYTANKSSIPQDRAVVLDSLAPGAGSTSGARGNSAVDQPPRADASERTAP